MVKQRTNPNGFTLNEEGTFDFTVHTSPEQKVTKKGTKLMKWFFSTVKKGEQVIIETVFFDFNVKDLLLVLGAEEDPESGILDWDDEEVVGKQFAATIIHEEDKNGIMREQWIDFEVIDVEKESVMEKAKAATDELKPEDIVWDN